MIANISWLDIFFSVLVLIYYFWNIYIQYFLKEEGSLKCSGILTKALSEIQFKQNEAQRE